jgi:hypothetical protein
VPGPNWETKPPSPCNALILDAKRGGFALDEGDLPIWRSPRRAAATPKIAYIRAGRNGKPENGTAIPGKALVSHLGQVKAASSHQGSRWRIEE